MQWTKEVRRVGKRGVGRPLVDCIRSKRNEFAENGGGWRRMAEEYRDSCEEDQGSALSGEVMWGGFSENVLAR